MLKKVKLKLYCKIPEKHKTSLIKLIQPGKPILVKVKININVQKIGITKTKPLKYKIFLVKKRSYKAPKQKKTPADVNPCATIINKPPNKPFKVFVNNANTTKFICTTDE